jgi:hypothetical protein
VGQLTTYAEKKILDHLLKVASYSPPAANAFYVGFSTANPTADGSGWTDPTYTGYARKAIDFTAASARGVLNNGLITFDTCTGGISTCTYFGIWDAVTGGHLLAYGALTPNKVITVSNVPTISDGALSIAFTAGVIFTPIANTIMDWLFNGGSLSQPTHVKVGLSTTTPTDGGPTITEPVGNGYAQVNVDAWDAAAGSPEATANTNAITLGPPSGSWGICTHAVIWLDTSPFIRGAITSQTPDNGDTVQWSAGEFDISLQ